jgi:hypothetical protein
MEVSIFRNTDCVQELKGINMRAFFKMLYSLYASQFSEISMTIKVASSSHILSITAVRFLLKLRIKWELLNIAASEP